MLGPRYPLPDGAGHSQAAYVENCRGACHCDGPKRNGPSESVFTPDTG